MTQVRRELSKCPYCGARGVRVADRHVTDGFELRFDYCGVCGKNWPEDPPTAREKVVPIRPPEPKDEA